MITDYINPHVLELFGWLLVLLVIILVAGRIIAKIRSEPVQREPEVSELMAKYRELHSRGELSDEEFRTIKTTLAQRFQSELRDEGETGCDT